MSVFTMKLKEILTSEGGNYRIENGKVIVEQPELIGLGHYPIHDEAHRDVLNGLIFGTYMNREIGSETYEMWLVDILTHMNLNMPYYVELYEANELDNNPLSTINLRTTSASESEQVSESEGSSDTNSTTTSKSRAVNSETPQSMLAGNADYATTGADSSGVSANEGTGHETGKNTTEGEGTSESETSGYQGHSVELLARYRETRVSVDRMVIASLEPFFMSIWSTPNRMFPERGTHYVY